MKGATWPLEVRTGGPLPRWAAAVPAARGFLGCDEPLPRSGGRNRLRFWFTSAAARGRARARLETLLADAPGTVGILEPDARAPRDWNAPFRRFFQGTMAGGFFVHPQEVPPHRTLPSLVIEPGMAFGTGSHPTTRLALDALGEALGPRRRLGRRRPRVLDLGTGSGILAAAAIRLGAAAAVGLDIDPDAVMSAGATAARNRTACRTTILEADFAAPGASARLRELAPEGFHLVVANLSVGLLEQALRFTRRHLRAGGAAVIAGFLRGEAPKVIGAWEAGGFRLQALRAELPDPPDSLHWIAATLKRGAQ